MVALNRHPFSGAFRGVQMMITTEQELKNFQAFYDQLRSRYPDREPPEAELNQQRALAAQVALTAYGEANGEAALCDLLNDLMHWAHCNGADFSEALARARRTYRSEVRDAEAEAR